MTFVTEQVPSGTTRLSAERKKKASEEIEKQRKEHSKKVKGIFKSLETPGATITFSFREFKGEPIRTYELVDGQTYDLPLGVARHINRQCKYKRNKHLVNKDGTKIKGLDTPVERYSFVSSEYN